MTKNISISHKQWTSAPDMQIDTQKTYSATIATNKGDIVADLHPQHAPVTVNNFVFLVGQGFYDGITFHRVIRNFMIQTGDPTGTGRGGPGYRFKDEIRGNPLMHETGALSMANFGSNTNGSQFFITQSPQRHIDGKYTVFGKVSSGMKVVNAIDKGDPIISIVIHEGRQTSPAERPVQQTPTQGVFCIKCGAKNPIAANFCYKCGMSIGLGENTEARVDYEICQIECQFNEGLGEYVGRTFTFWADAIGSDGKFNAAHLTWKEGGLLTSLSGFRHNPDGPDGSCIKCLEAHSQLVQHLARAGWQPTEERGKFWYQLRFRRRSG